MIGYIVILSKMTQNYLSTDVLYLSLDKYLARKFYTKIISKYSKRSIELKKLFIKSFDQYILQNEKRNIELEMFTIKQNDSCLYLIMQFDVIYQICIQIVETDVAFLEH